MVNDFFKAYVKGTLLLSFNTHDTKNMIDTPHGSSSSFYMIYISWESLDFLVNWYLLLLALFGGAFLPGVDQAAAIATSFLGGKVGRYSFEVLFNDLFWVVEREGNI